VLPRLNATALPVPSCVAIATNGLSSCSMERLCSARLMKILQQLAAYVAAPGQLEIGAADPDPIGWRAAAAIALIAARIQRADHAAGAGAHDDIHPDAALLERLDHADVREAPLTAATQRQSQDRLFGLQRLDRNRTGSTTVLYCIG